MMSMLHSRTTDCGLPVTQNLAQRHQTLASRLEVPGVSHTGRVMHFAQDCQIYVESDEARSYFKVVSGVVRTCKLFDDGRRQIDQFYLAGELFGIDGGSRYTLSAEAVSTCTVIVYRRKQLDSLVAEDVGLAAQFIAHTLDSLARAQHHIQVLGRCNAPQKVAAFLLDIVERGSNEIELPMGRQDIADYLGLSLETVSRTLSQMERSGVIRLTTARRVRILNRAALVDNDA